jgi:hypothetical protein
VQEQKLRSLATKSRIGGGKNLDKQLTFFVRVMGQVLFICLDTRKLYRYATLFLSDYFIIGCLVLANLLVSARERKILKFL